MTGEQRLIVFVTAAAVALVWTGLRPAAVTEPEPELAA